MTWEAETIRIYERYLDEEKRLDPQIHFLENRLQWILAARLPRWMKRYAAALYCARICDLTEQAAMRARRRLEIPEIKKIYV